MADVKFSPIRPPPNACHGISRAKLDWLNTHPRICKYQCRTPQAHFDKWRRVYDTDLWDLYTVFHEHVTAAKEERKGKEVAPIKVTFNQFIGFVYHNSSGYVI